MANPRKFSEKIALQKQKQAEGTAEFEKIMNEVKATRVVDVNLSSNTTDLNDGNVLNRNASLSGGSGGGSGTSSGASGGGASPDANASGGLSCGGVGIINTAAGSPTAYRESRGRSVGVGPMRRPSERKQDRSPYGSTASGLMLSGISQHTQNSYLSPPMDSSWRRSNSDSALHQTLNMAEGNFGSTSPQPSVMDDLNSLHANYHQHQHPHNHTQRSQSPNIGRSYSPQAQRRKNTLLQQQQQQLQQQQQQQQLHNHHLQMQQQQQAQHQQLQQHLQNQQQHTLQQQHLHHQQQQQQYANAKYNNANIMFKSLHEQQLSFNNTGSLPDLTSVHYATVAGQAGNSSNSQMMATSTTQPQQTLSPILSPHHHNNGCHERDQSPSPFSPASGAGGGNSSGGGPPSPYHQQQNSPTSTTNTHHSTANVQTSPHLSFTNLAVNVQSSNATTAQNSAAAFSTLPTLGAASSTGNLTEYRQPPNPPSPGSSPGLLTTANPVNDLNTSAPPSPIRHNGGGNSNSQNSPSQMPTQSLQNTFGNLDASTGGYNTLNPAFHNHFEQFHLGDNSQSPQNSYDGLEFDELGIGNHQNSTFNSKIMDFGDLTANTSSSNTRTNNTNTVGNNNNNNNSLPQQHQQRHNTQQFHQQQQQQILNNNTTTSRTSSNTNTNGTTNPCRSHNTAATALMNNNDSNRPQDILSANSSPIPSPITHCVPAPSSPLPIPMSAHPPTHHQQQLSLSVQTSPHHSPMHTPHHSPSPLSVSSPGMSLMGGGSASPLPSPTGHLMQQQHQQNHINNQTAIQMHHNQQAHHTNHQQQPHQHHHQQQQTHTPTTTTNIPQIIFSDYSSSRDIFDTLDLDLGQIDGPGLQMLSDQSPIMIADPSIEDSFRRDLN